MKAKQLEDPEAAKVHRIRITLTSRNVKNLEKGASHSCLRLCCKIATPAFTRRSPSLVTIACSQFAAT